MIAAQHGKGIDGTAALRLQAPTAVEFAHDGAMAYYQLCGCDPHEAVVDDDTSFDRHVLAAILAVAATGPGGICASAGLAAPDLAALIAQWFPLAAVTFVGSCQSATATEDDEVVMVRDMLLTQRSTSGDVGRWLAAMVARRTVESNHLWEDLGLRNRSELSRLLTRHFAPLAVRNTGNMRWKRFFYRMLCEQDGFAMCTTPVCTDCRDFTECFGEESGESRMADRRRQLSLQQHLNQSASAGVETLSTAAE